MDRGIPLAAMLAQLRNELLEAQHDGEDAALRFRIEDIEIELQIATTLEKKGGGGVKFWVIDADAEAKKASANTQKLKLKMRAVGSGGEPAEISDQRRR